MLIPSSGNLDTFLQYDVELDRMPQIKPDAGIEVLW